MRAYHLKRWIEEMRKSETAAETAAEEEAETTGEQEEEGTEPERETGTETVEIGSERET